MKTAIMETLPEETNMRRKHAVKKRIPAGERVGRLLKRIAFVVLSVLVVYPLIWNILSSFKTNSEILDSPWGLPQQLNFANYDKAFNAAHIGDYFLNSVYVTVFSLALLLFFCLTTTYAMLRFRNRISAAVRGVYMAGLFIQTPVLMVPLFLLMGSLGMVDNREGLVLVYALGVMPFSVYLLSGYMSMIPKDYEESAMMDGCGRWRMLFSIVTPLVQPGLVTVALFNFFTFWNEYPMALTLLYSEDKRTLPIGLSSLFEVQRYSTDWGALFAGLAIVLVPTIVVYAVAQKRLTSGIMMGGIKG